ncbi:MAG: T9SS type A sorting domain-containing protein, partial [Ignavibacteria bacterium]
VRLAVPSSGGNLDPVGFSNSLKGWTANHGSSGLWQTTNGGFNWNFINVGNALHGIFILNDSIGYASGAQILKYTNTIVGISFNEKNFIPHTHTLKQNFPNPFNISTIITYTLITRTNVIMEIYSVNGEFVSLLERGYKNPGEYSVIWNAENLASGIYYYSLRTDQGNFFGKAVLLK